MEIKNEYQARNEDQTQIAKLIEIGIALTNESNLQTLLELILREARGFTRADAGSLFIREQEKLRFIVSQNTTLEKRLGPAKLKQLFKPFDLPINHSSIAGYVAATGETLNIPDVYQLDNTPYGFNSEFDRLNDYRACSMLVIPLKDPAGTVLGVLQLINSLDIHDSLQSFPEEIMELSRALASQAAVAIKNAQLIEQVKKSHYDTILKLSVAAEYRDKITANHLQRVSHYGRILANTMGIPKEKIELLFYAAPMHDIGKLGIPDGVLLKRGPLTNEEFELMKTHTVIGSSMFEDSDNPLFEVAQNLALYHHERFDGSGYPGNKKGDEIPLEARIIAVADVFDALTTQRSYKEEMSVQEALDIIDGISGTHLDSIVVDALHKSIHEIMEIKGRFSDE